MRVCFFAVLAAALLTFTCDARAQDFGAAFSGFDTGSNNPIQIEADKLEVRDQDKVAVYSGHVRIRQGETILEAPELRIFYAGDSPKAGTGGTTEASPVAGPLGSKVSRIEAGPGVNVRAGDRTASGDRAVFDMGKNLVTLSGNVVLTQGQYVVRGERLVVDLTTKRGRVEGGRVQTLITPTGVQRKP
jgi:lipopolysaccharide export system protein LptA